MVFKVSPQTFAACTTDSTLVSSLAAWLLGHRTFTLSLPILPQSSIPNRQQGLSASLFVPFSRKLHGFLAAALPPTAQLLTLLPCVLCRGLAFLLTTLPTFLRM